MTDDPARTTEAAPPVLSHLVYLDVDDEITSAASRIRTTESPQITLVLPYGSRLATSRINFRLLAREATERGKRLDIVTGDASARALAAAAGLPVHTTVAAYEATRAGVARGEAEPRNGHEQAASHAAAATAAVGAPATQPQPTAGADEDDVATTAITIPRRSSPRVPIVGPARAPVEPRIAIAVGAVVVVAVLLVGLLAMELLPAATIVLHPRSEEVGPVRLSVAARTDVTSPDTANLVIPAQRFTFDLEASQTITATGTKVEDVKATGEVVFSNSDNGTGVFIPKGTIVRTRGHDRIEFATLDALTLPRADYNFFTGKVTPSTGSVGVEAVVPGETGNVGDNTITDVIGGGRLLRVENPNPTTGGAHVELPQISQDDVDAAISAIDTALGADLDEQLGAGTVLPSGLTLVLETRSVGEPQFDTDPQSLVGTTDPTEVVLQASAEGSVVAVDPSPIRDLAIPRLDSEVDEGWRLADGSATFDLGEPTILGDTISFPVTVGATQVRVVDRDALLAEIRGLVLAQARARLEAYGSVTISLWPDWVTTVPTNDDRVDFTIAEPQPAPSPTP